jgi:4-phospho-D-threonate 3-dehydrogenase / 4-phospho-D-erythronate 3-dehydrogenase
MKSHEPARVQDGEPNRIDESPDPGDPKMTMTIDTRPIVAVTVGEPAGIGPEVVVQAVLDPDVAGRGRLCVVGERAAIIAAAGLLRRASPLDLVRDPAAAAYRPGTITLIDTATLPEQIPWGKISAEGGRAAFACVKEAITLSMAGKAAAIATAPIHKESLRRAEIPFIDHTSMLKALTNAPEGMTMFATGKLRIFFLTRHLALRDVPAALTRDGVVEGIRSCIEHLAALGLARPRLAVAALNPHGGEHGLFGTEEDDILRPAIERAKRETAAEVVGPVPADAVFHQGAQGAYDAILSLYHDQGHIAAKTLDFHGTVSFTLGLPFLRTSVDHGTAFDIAGRGIADARGMKAAIHAACAFGPSYRAYRHQPPPGGGGHTKSR